jgi:hypothetical protein
MTNRTVILELTAKNHLRRFIRFATTELSGLMSYAFDLPALYSQIADQIDQKRLVKPGDISFFQASKFELIINLKTAASSWPSFTRVWHPARLRQQDRRLAASRLVASF